MVHLNQGRFLIVAHPKIVQRPMLTCIHWGCGHVPSYFLRQVKDITALSPGCLLLVTRSLARCHPLANLSAQPGYQPLAVTQRSACLI